MSVVWSGAGALWMLGAGDDWTGKGAFMGVFVLLILLLVLLPPRLAGDDDGRSRWWRNARLWAILIVLVQIMIYAWWG